MPNYSELRPFCTTVRQMEIIDCLVAEGSQGRACKALGVNARGIERVLARIRKEALKRGFDPEHQLTHPAAPGNQIQRISTNYDADGEVKQQWVIQKPGAEAQEEAYRAFVEGLSEEVKRAKPQKISAKKTLNSDLASAIIFGDAHIGSLAHAAETNGPDHTLETATADIRAAMDYLVSCATASNEGYFINVGDFLHVCSSANTTVGGTKQDVSANFSQVMRAGATVIKYAINKMLTKFENVTVVNARGNHDGDAAFALNLIIEAYYENEPRVTVLANDSKFNYIEFGNCLLGITHGDKINHSRLCGVMTRDQAPAWGRTTFRRWITGHFHHAQVKEHDAGVTIETFATLAPSDAWHASSGYGAESKATLITYHREHGEVMRMAPSINLIKAQSL
jgi:hypothetical protein